MFIAKGRRRQRFVARDGDAVLRLSCQESERHMIVEVKSTASDGLDRRYSPHHLLPQGRRFFIGKVDDFEYYYVGDAHQNPPAHPSKASNSRMLSRAEHEMLHVLLPEYVGPRPQMTARAKDRAENAFSILGLILPKRVAAEELGDALEMIRDISNRCCPPWRIYLKLGSTIFWVFINTIREFTGAVLGRKRA